jgi:hypothetical protein
MLHTSEVRFDEPDHVQPLEILPESEVRLAAFHRLRESEVRFVEPDHRGFTDRRPAGSCRNLRSGSSNRTTVVSPTDGRPAQ